MKLSVPVKTRVETSTLFARGVDIKNISWIRGDAKEKELTLGAYLNVVIGQLQAGSSNKKVSTKRSKVTKVASKPRTVLRKKTRPGKKKSN